MGHRKGQTTQQPQQGGATDRQAQSAAHSHPRPAPQRHGDMRQPVDKSRRAPCPWGDQRGQPRGNQAAGTAAIGPEELPYLSVEHDPPWPPGQIRHRAAIATVEAPGRILADRAVNQGSCRRHWQRQPPFCVVPMPGIQVERGNSREQACQSRHVWSWPPEVRTISFSIIYTLDGDEKNFHQNRPRAHTH